MKKRKSVKRNSFVPMPPFKTYEEEAEFWDTHSAVDDINDGTVVGYHVANKNKTVTVRFEERDFQRLREEAFAKGIGPTTLIRMWVREKLQTKI